MAVTVSQEWNGSQVDIDDAGSAKITSDYLIFGTSDEFTAQSALLAATAAAVGSLVKKSSRITERVDETTWRGQVVWSRTISKQQLAQAGAGGNLDSSGLDGAYEFDTTGGTAHITQSLETVQSYDDGGVEWFNSAPDFRGAIGVSQDTIEGTDIVVPKFNWSETHEFTGGINTAGQLTIRNLTGRTNDDTFRGHAAGEVLFMGARGSKRNSGLWSLTFNFAASPNVTGLTIGTITGIAKKGWEYLWVHYRETVDATASAIVKAPSAVYVERVYDEGDFTLLGIG